MKIINWKVQPWRNPMKPIASVHRFGDKVAVFVGDGSTTYLTAKQARRLGAALRECARSVVFEKFIDSKFEPRNIEPVSDEDAKAEVAKFPRNRKLGVDT